MLFQSSTSYSLHSGVSVEPRGCEPAFDRRAGTYDAHAHVQRDTAGWVAEWLPEPGQWRRCLEFGAGTGNFTRHLLGRFEQVLATDHAPAMVARGRAVLPEVSWDECDAWAPLARLAEHRVPGGAVGVEGTLFDYLVSCSVLQWAPDPVAVLSGWRALLRPGGGLLSGIYLEPSLPEFGALEPTRRPFPWRSADEWCAHFRSAGFTVTRCETRTRAYFYPDARALLRQLHGTGTTPAAARLSPGAMRTLLRRYDHDFGGPDGVRATWTTGRIEARIG